MSPPRDPRRLATAYAIIYGGLLVILCSILGLTFLAGYVSGAAQQEMTCAK